jgi:hypothetical protein
MRDEAQTNITPLYPEYRTPATPPPAGGARA